MKKILLGIIYLVVTNLIVWSQDTMYIFKNGKIIGSFPTSSIDSVTFYKLSANNNASISGFAQKGPFVNGSSVTVFDLQSNLSQTGKSFNAQITDNKGTFQVSDIPLSSSLVSLRADGFYFNEILGQQSASQITLNALADISGNNAVNINLLTHLEMSRVEYLMKAGKSFSDSKIQAQKEILAIFNIQKSDSVFSENLNISQTGDDNGILLAVSSILQAYRTESELTELLSDISEDIKEDGILSSDTLGSALINQAIYLDTISIKNNLANRYIALGATASIPDFGKYIKNFISNTKFIVTHSVINYPETGLNGSNILSLTKTRYSANGSNSLAAQLPKGTALKIRITSLSADTTIVPPTDSTASGITVSKPAWYMEAFSGINWSISDFDFTNYVQTFTAVESDKSCDLQIYFQKGSFLIEYFEMNALAPTRKKTIICN
jgi:hypothetical protein